MDLRLGVAVALAVLFVIAAASAFILPFFRKDLTRHSIITDMMLALFTVIFVAIFLQYMDERLSGVSNEDIIQRFQQLGRVDYLTGEPNLYQVSKLYETDLKRLRIYAPVGLWTITEPVESDYKVQWLKVIQARVRDSAFDLEAAYGLPPSSDDPTRFAQAVCVLAGFAGAKRTVLRTFEAPEATGFKAGFGILIAEYQEGEADGTTKPNPKNTVYFGLATLTSGTRVDSAVVVTSFEAFSMARNWWEQHSRDLGEEINPADYPSPNQLAERISKGRVTDCAGVHS